MNLDNCLMEKVVKLLASYIRLCCSYFLCIFSDIGCLEEKCWKSEDWKCKCNEGYV